MAEAFAQMWIGLVIGVLLAGPILSFVLSLAGQSVRPRRARQLAGGAALVLGTAMTPLSLPGHLPDSVLLGLACMPLSVSVGAVSNTWFQRFGAVVLLMLAAVPGAFAVIGAVPGPYERTVDAGCGHQARIEPWGWVATGGQAAVVLWHPWWSPVEVELARRQFDFGGYPETNRETRFGAAARGRCGVGVTYDGRTVWRAR